MGGLLTGGVGVALFTGLASVLIEIIKVHDAIYDKYVVRWRLRYDTDFILQRLLKPFAVDLELFLEGPTDFAITITRRKITPRQEDSLLYRSDMNPPHFSQIPPAAANSFNSGSSGMETPSEDVFSRIVGRG